MLNQDTAKYQLDQKISLQSASFLTPAAVEEDYKLFILFIQRVPSLEPTFPEVGKIFHFIDESPETKKKLTKKTQKALWEKKKLVLPERLSNPQYGRDELDRELRMLAQKAPGIEKIWQISEKLPSLTDLILEERANE